LVFWGLGSSVFIHRAFFIVGRVDLFVGRFKLRVVQVACKFVALVNQSNLTIMYVTQTTEKYPRYFLHEKPRQHQDDFRFSIEGWVEIAFMPTYEQAKNILANSIINSRWEGLKVSANITYTLSPLEH
jgi:hypothetical protein